MGLCPSAAFTRAAVWDILLLLVLCCSGTALMLTSQQSREAEVLTHLAGMRQASWRSSSGPRSWPFAALSL
jgi:hypothetical protein